MRVASWDEGGAVVASGEGSLRGRRWRSGPHWADKARVRAWLAPAWLALLPLVAWPELPHPLATPRLAWLVALALGLLPALAWLRAPISRRLTAPAWAGSAAACACIDFPLARPVELAWWWAWWPSPCGTRHWTTGKRLNDFR